MSRRASNVPLLTVMQIVSAAYHHEVWRLLRPRCQNVAFQVGGLGFLEAACLAQLIIRSVPVRVRELEVWAIVRLKALVWRRWELEPGIVLICRALLSISAGRLASRPDLHLHALRSFKLGLRHC